MPSSKKNLETPQVYKDQEMEFFGLKLHITPDVLIPRLETELLVEHVLKRLEGKSGRVLDLCSGSGCIGLSIKKNRPDLQVILSDISENALELSKKNAKENRVEVEFVLGDLRIPDGVDFVVCNPPYVSLEEYRELDSSVKDYEPKIALTDDSDGLQFYRRLACELPAKMNSHALLFCEIGFNQKDSILKIFEASALSPWHSLQVLKDYSGHDRFFFASI